MSMTHSVNRQILLKSRPEGAPSLDNFELRETSVPQPGNGEVLIRTLYLSLDPYMRGRMNAAKSYAKPAEVGQPMVGGTVGEIIAHAILNTRSATSFWATAAGRSTRFQMAPGCASSTPPSLRSRQR
jgi:NADPH-dependent curcumin reductase CurA